MEITWTFLFARNFWAQPVPSSSAEAMKQVSSWIGWPSTPPSSALMYLIAISVPSVACWPITCGPPCWLTKPTVTGVSELFAGPDLPPV